MVVAVLAPPLSVIAADAGPMEWLDGRWCES
jgi:hypothetical protein